jgi:hypothetical protein
VSDVGKKVGLRAWKRSEEEEEERYIVAKKQVVLTL